MALRKVFPIAHLSPDYPGKQGGLVVTRYADEIVLRSRPPSHLRMWLPAWGAPHERLIDDEAQLFVVSLFDTDARYGVL